MQMTISTTGRRQLCILCSVCVLSKMLKLCGAEGSSSGDWWVLAAVSVSSIQFVFEVDLGAEQCFVCWRCTRSIRYDAVVRLWLMHSVVEIHWNFEVDHVSEVACWILSTVCVEAASVQQWGVRSLDAIECCQLFVTDLAFWCFHQTHWLLGLVRVVGKECPLLRSFRFCFCSGSLPMLSVLRWGLSIGELAVARTIWRVSVVGGVRLLFDRFQLLLRSIRFLVSEVDLFAVEISQTFSEVDLFAVEIYQTLFLR